MKGSIRVAVAAGLVLAGNAVLAAGPRGFEASFSPVAVGEAPVTDAAVDSAPQPVSAPVPVTQSAPLADAAPADAGEGVLAVFASEAVGSDAEAEEALRRLTEEAAALAAEGDSAAVAIPLTETTEPAAIAPAVTSTPAGVPAAEAAIEPAAEAVADTPVTAGETFTFSETPPEPQAAPEVPAEATTEATAEPAPELAAEPAPDPEPVAEEPAFIDPVAAAEEERLREEKRAARRAMQGPYFGISGGNDRVSISGVNDGPAQGLLAGFRYSQMIGFELALARAEYDVPGSGVNNCLLDNETLALYVAARSEERFYLKGRAGVLSETMESSGGCAAFSGSDAGFSASAGAGIRMGSTAMEIEYTLVDKQIGRLSWTFLLNF